MLLSIGSCLTHAVVCMLAVAPQVLLRLHALLLLLLLHWWQLAWSCIHQSFTLEAYHCLKNES